MQKVDWMIDGDRLWTDLMNLGEIGREKDGGVTRTSFDPADIVGRKFLIELLDEAGLNPKMDAVGNIFGEIIGDHPDLPEILIGSHIDSVRSGGRFDGAMGVLMGVEVLRTLKEKGVRPKRTVRVVSLTDEEGARFDFAFVGSLALTGSVPAEIFAKQLMEAKDSNGVSYFDVLNQARHEGGLFNQIDPHSLDEAKWNKERLKAYIEVHIEQGKVLEGKNLPVGIVNGITGGQWSDVSIWGEAGHAGTIGMDQRLDALTTAAECILAVEDISRRSGGSVATVGKLEVKPGSSNVIPGRVDFTLDIRDLLDERKVKTTKEISHAIQAICEKRGLIGEITPVQSLSSVFSSANVIGAMREAFAELGCPVCELPSGAAHDAMIMAEVTDIGMLFVRSKDGISHHPKEWSSKEDVMLGCELLYRTVINLL